VDVTDAEILDQIGNLRIQLSENMNHIAVDDTNAILIQAALFISGIDAMLQMRQR
jgi:hypothetical protein